MSNGLDPDQDLGQSFFIFCFTDFFSQMRESEDEKKIKIKFKVGYIFFRTYQM